MSFKKIPVFLLLFLLLTLAGCGKTNVFEWTKPADSTSLTTLDQAKKYIDEAEYKKALSLLDEYLKNHASDKEANILYGQCQLGLADVDLASIIGALAEETPTPSMEKLNSICSSAERGRVYDAADRFNAYPPTDPSDKVIAAITGMIAYTKLIYETFDPSDTGLNTVSGTDPAGATAASGVWATMGNKENTYLGMAFNNLASLSGDQDLENAVTSMNTTLTYIENNIGAANCAQVRAVLLSF